MRTRYGYTAEPEPKVCACQAGEDAHEWHRRPLFATALHHPDCRHSDLWRTAVVLAGEQARDRTPKPRTRILRLVRLVP